MVITGVLATSCETISLGKIVNWSCPNRTDSSSKTQVGKVSWYSTDNGLATASGIPLDDNKLTAAHKTLPMGTRVMVTNTSNNKKCKVTITDRGPYISGRIIDVTPAAAFELGILSSGVAPCKIEILKR